MILMIKISDDINENLQMRLLKVTVSDEIIGKKWFHMKLLIM